MNIMSDLTRLILLIIALGLSFFFALAESSFSFANQIKLKVRAEDGSKSANLVLRVLNKFDNFIIDVLIGTNISHVLVSILATILTVNLVYNNVNNMEIATSNGAIIATAASTIVVFFICEMIPKTIGKAKSESIACFCVYPMVILNYILLPISIIFRGLIYLGRKIFKVDADEPILSEDDFQDIIEDIEKEGQIEEEESEIIQSAVDFDDLKVKEVMCPKDEVVALDISKKLTSNELIEFITDNNFSRIPVYRDNLDNVVGILHTRILLKALMQNKDYDLEKLLVKPLEVRPNMHLDTIFDEFKKKKTHIAIVKDKENKTLGIVTMEDVLEELVGDIDESEDGGYENE